MKKLFSVIFLNLALAFNLFGVSGALAAGAFENAKVTTEVSAGSDLGVEYPKASGLGSTDIRITIAKMIRVAISLLGIIAVVIVLIGGFTWMTAGGNDEKVGEAKKWIESGIIGLAIIFSAYALTTYIIVALVNATTSGEALIPLAP